jgi:hypothetical protein
MSRETLPNRRPNETVTVWHKGNLYEVTVGFDPETLEPVEAFIHGDKPGSDGDAIQYDFGVLVSIAMQHGASPQSLRRSLCTDALDDPATIAGAVMDVIDDMIETARE